jgi:dehypoxanthine futalosine cyclase
MQGCLDTEESCMQRVTPEQTLEWLRHADTTELMEKAHKLRQQRYGDHVYYVHSLNINPTNICKNKCGLCAFWRESDARDAYFLDLPQIQQRLTQAAHWQLKDLHVVGGLTDEQDLDYYCQFFKQAKTHLPEAIIQGLTAVEIDWLARHANQTLGNTLQALQEAGLDAIPGGGAEVFSQRVRELICPNKISGDRWLDIHRAAHALGIQSNATLLFGHIETPEEIVDHLTRLRDLQDETHGFLAFCPLPFHPDGTSLGVEHGPTGHMTVRLVALARIFLDNVPHIRVLANYLDRKLLQTLLWAGADDVGGTSMDERIAKAAGASETSLFSGPADMEAFIKNLGLRPVLTNSLYQGIPAVKPCVSRDKMSPHVSSILNHVRSGGRLSAEQAITLGDQAPLHALGQAAHEQRCARVGIENATFIVDRNISFTNVCTVKCKFCAFCRNPGASDAFVLSIEEIVDRVQEAVDLGATQIMLQGGLNPDLDLSWYERLLGSIKSASPGIWLHSLSPAEILWLSQCSGLPLSDTIKRLHEAGLDSLPGGGAEILVDEVRARVSPAKLSSNEWFLVMRTAQEQGLSTTATMVYGLGETTAQRVAHLLRVRELQDQTGGFTAFIPWSFQSNHTQLSETPQTGVDYLRVVALARLVLDNIPHIQAGWVTEGPDMAQLALRFGADDLGGVLMEESVVSATGLDFAMTQNQAVRLIAQAGFIPVQRNTQYQHLKTFESNDPTVRSEASCS